ncbi:MAG: hypothetical protein JSV33_02570 [bacterium]|nr:MAG: hypothetical protein JSV33_02570 [bacterium]
MMVKVKQSFEVKDCALAAIATGKHAENLKELRNIIVTIQPSSLYYHFWGQLLRPRFDDPEYNNDFAIWARHALHDGILAERLGMLDPVEFPDLEDLRRELVDIIEEHLDDSEIVPWCHTDQQYHFITSQIVVFNTNKTIERPRELVKAVPSMTRSSVFYHFIDARRRTFGNMDDFSAWLYGFNNRYVDLCNLLSTVDPFFSTLSELRQQLTDLFTGYFGE